MTNPASGDDAARVELLPCPFCGGAAKHVRRNDSHETYRFVVCSENSEHRSGNGCYNQAPGINGDSGKCYKCWNEGTDCVFATKAWNARAAIAAMPVPAASPDLECQIGSCQRHGQCMYHPCRSDKGAVDQVKAKDAEITALRKALAQQVAK